MLYTSLDLLKPAVVSFAPGAENILLVNNTIAQPYDYGHKEEYEGTTTRTVNIDTDSLPLFTLSALQEELTASGFFKNVDVLLQSVNDKTDFFVVRPLLPESATSLAKTYGADVILSLNRLKVNDLVGESYLSEEHVYYTALVARYESQWTVHYPDKAEAERYIFRDTVFWESEDISWERALANLPDKYDALVDGALYAGQSTLKRLIPYWTSADRYFFGSNNKKMKAGLDSIYTKNWQAAIDIWEKALPDCKKSLKGQVANNLAVAYELNGDVNKAAEYAQMALDILQSNMGVKIDHLSIVSDYLDQLKLRKREVELINKQLSD
jgi:tetratricopeptide (TPR) repeat protein